LSRPPAPSSAPRSPGACAGPGSRRSGTTCTWPTEDLAGLTPRFIELLPEFLPAPERGRSAELRSAFERWRAGAEGRVPAPPFAGNVSGQGPGFAELPMRRPTPVGLLAIDDVRRAAKRGRQVRGASEGRP
jgi:hypothetical protein